MNKKLKEKLRSIQLIEGDAHPQFEKGVCVMEAAFIAGEKHTYQTSCTCPLITSLMIEWNNSSYFEGRYSSKQDVSRTKWLKPLLPYLIKTRASRKVQKKRFLFLAKWIFSLWSKKSRVSKNLPKIEIKSFREVRRLVDYLQDMEDEGVYGVLDECLNQYPEVGVFSFLAEHFNGNSVNKKMRELILKLCAIRK